MFPGRIIIFSGALLDPHARLVFHYQTTAFGATLQARYKGTSLVHPDDLKQRIQKCIQGITTKVIQSVMTAITSRLQECIERHGGHRQSVLVKQRLFR